MRPFLVLVLGLVTLLLAAQIPVAAQSATPAASPPVAASGDFTGLVDIGGDRRLWLECRGSGNPTVVLESGYGNNADVWDAVVLPPDASSRNVVPITRNILPYMEPASYAAKRETGEGGSGEGPAC